MSTLKDVLCLLAIFVAFGIAGRLDYEDAVMLEEVQQAPAHTGCSPVATSAVSEPPVPPTDRSVDPQPIAAPPGLQESTPRCAVRVL
jgi:hypothetical protein